jgi:hypothetical protein
MMGSTVTPYSIQTICWSRHGGMRYDIRAKNGFRDIGIEC